MTFTELKKQAKSIVRDYYTLSLIEMSNKYNPVISELTLKDFRMLEIIFNLFMDFKENKYNPEDVNRHLEEHKKLFE